MIQLIQFLLTLLTTSVRSRLSLQAENAALRNQLYLYRRSGQRPSIRPADRLLWCFIAKFWAGWRAALYFVQPRTVTTWQKKRFRDYWRALSQSTKTGRPRISPELRKLIERMWEANPTWGSPKIVAELAMLGIDVAKSTVEKYKPKRTGPHHLRGEHSWTSTFEISSRSTFSSSRRLRFGCCSSSSCWPTTGGELFTST
jgi:hypothetical protein